MSSTITIPSQSYYNMIVYDLDADGVNQFFASAGEMKSERVKYLTEVALDYINDRLAEGSHSTEDDNLPDTEDIQDKVEVLEKWRRKHSTGDVDDYLDYDF